MHSTEIRLFASSVKVLQQGTTKWIGKNNSRGSSRTHRKPPIEYKPRDPDSTSTSAGPRLGPKRKVACLFGYNGTGYSGLQFNPDTDKTIESDLFKGLVASGLVSKENSTDLKKVGFMRAARTDKGVHAAGNLVSFKAVLPQDSESTVDGMKRVVENINQHLPEKIRVWGLNRVTKGFNCKNMCGSRVYEYLIPSYVVLPPRADSYLGKKLGMTTDVKFWADLADKSDQEKYQALKDYRISEKLLSDLKAVFQIYQGGHNFHNYTIGKDFLDPSSKRYIDSVNVSDPQIIDNTEWISIKLHGQSFMIHQIRKIISMGILTIRTDTPLAKVQQTFNNHKLNIPKAPSLGLLLEHPVYDGYNRLITNKFTHLSPITFEPYQSEIDGFKKNSIYMEIYEQENQEWVFWKYFRYLDDFDIEDNNGGSDFIFEYLGRNSGNIPVPRAIDVEIDN